MLALKFAPDMLFSCNAITLQKTLILFYGVHDFLNFTVTIVYVINSNHQ